MKISINNQDGSLLSDEEFKAEKAILISEKQSLEAKLNGTGEKVEEWMERVEKSFDFAVNARVRFANASLSEKREILSTIGSDFILKDKTLYMDVQKPFCWLSDVVKEVPTTSQMFGTKEKGSTITQIESSWSTNPVVLRR